MCEEPLQAGNGPCDVCGLWHPEGIVVPQDVVSGRSSPAAADAEVPGFNLEVATSVEVRHLNSEVATSVEVQASESSIGGATPSSEGNVASAPAVFSLSRSPSCESVPLQGDALDSRYDSNPEWENCRYLVPEMLSALQQIPNEPEVTQFVLESCFFPMHCDLHAASLSISRQRLALLEPCSALIEEWQQQVEDLEAQASVLLRYEQKHRVCRVTSKDKLLDLDERVCALAPGDLGENEETPLQTKTIPAEIVRQSLAKWTPSMHEEYDSLVVSTQAVSPLSDLEVTRLVSAQGGNVELIPGKAAFTKKAFSGRFKTRVVGCGNFQTSTTREKTDVYASGAPCESIRLLVRRAALDSEWILGSVDVKTAFLNVPVVTSKDTTIIVRVPAILRAAGVCQEKYWRVNKALYGPDVAPPPQRYPYRQGPHVPWPVHRRHPHSRSSRLAKWEAVERERRVPIPKEFSVPETPVEEREALTKQAQTMCGQLLWLSGRTRPDLAFAVTKACQVVASNPAEAVARCNCIVKYLRYAPSVGLHYGPAPDDFGQWAQLKYRRDASSIEVYSDASYGADFAEGCKGMSAHVYWGGALVMWGQCRQPLVPTSTAEAELIALAEAHLMDKAMSPATEALLEGITSPHTLSSVDLYSLL